MAHHHPYNLTTTPTTASPHDLFLTTPVLFPPFCFSWPHFIVNNCFLYDTNLHQIQLLIFCSFFNIWRFSRTNVMSKYVLPSPKNACLSKRIFQKAFHQSKAWPPILGVWCHTYLFSVLSTYTWCYSSFLGYNSQEFIVVLLNAGHSILWRA